MFFYRFLVLQFGIDSNKTFISNLIHSFFFFFFLPSSLLSFFSFVLRPHNSHAPISQRVFFFFNGHYLGDHGFLRKDYRIMMFGPRWNAFLPIVLAVGIVYTLGLPLCVLGVLIKHRRRLHTPRIESAYGFLYSRFKDSAPLWEVHEIFRKMILCGMLVYLPTTTRAAYAVMICVLACGSLNFYRPPKNKWVFVVAEVAFTSTAFKYIGTILLNISANNSKEVQTIGVVLLVVDATVMLAGIIAAIMLLCSMREVEKGTVNSMVGTGMSDSDAFATYLAQKNKGATAVVPAELTLQRSSILSLQQIRTVVVKDKVARVETSHAHSHKTAMDKILQRKKKADARVRQRLIERRNLKSSSEGNSEKSVSNKKKDDGEKITAKDLRSWNLAKMQRQQDRPSEKSLAMIEKVRVSIKQKIGTLKRLRKVFAKLDLDHNGVLSKGEFGRLTSAILKKKSIDKKVLRLLWEAAWEQRKHGTEDEIDAPTLGHWLRLD